ncbi:MAG: DMT family transporter [Hyphomicrobiales bacterium]|nr:DMT family transporter [Hyphomicrobiales bacterium]
MASGRRIIPALFVVLWATGFIGARYAMPWAEPFSFLAVRFAIAFAILAVAALAMGQGRITRRDATMAAFAGVLMHGVYLGGVFWAIRHGMPAGLSALIVGLQPLITALLAGSLLGETVLPRHWAGLGAGLAGVAIVLAPKLGAIGDGVTWATLAASFVAVAGMSAGTIWQKRFLTESNLLAGTCWQYAGGAALMAIASFALESRHFTLNGELVFAMAWAVLVLSIGAIVLLMVMIRDGEVAKVASLFYLVPAVTALMAWALFGEQLTLIQIGGMALTTIGVALATQRAPATAA